MGMITIICPVTGRPVETGMLMSRTDFERAVLERNELRCPACGRIHTWSKRDATLREDSPPKP